VRKRRAATETFSLAFLDCICCGFGAIILLLVLTKIGEPRALEAARSELEGLLARLQQEIHEIRGETAVLERDLTTREEQLSRERERIARLRGDLSRIEGQFASTSQHSEVSEIVEGRLLSARQQLSEEMKRLAAQDPRPRPAEAPIGGIPVDSEYVVFIIDTSGSMQRYAWGMVQRKMRETLDIYPKVKGLQVLNDMGQYMFPTYAGKWIPDTPGRRAAVLKRLVSWNAFSNSSPVEGIERAIRTFAVSERKISLYVFGDEFTGDSIDEVVHRVEEMNPRGQDGARRVRIHAVGFPVMFGPIGAPEHTGVRFATLMRILCERNDGSFVGLAETR
jgi:hypothetical protein